MKIPLRIQCGFKNHISSHILLKMKLTIFLLIAAFFQVQAEGYSQQITLSQKNAQLEDVFKQIILQTNFHFVYYSQALQEAKPVDIELKNASLSEALEQCFKDQPLTYVIENNTVVVKIKELPPPPIKGLIINEKGETLPGANVIIKGTNKGTASDVFGNFSIDAKIGDILLVSFIGYVPQEIKITNLSNITVTLKATLNTLNELVITGIFTKKAATYTGSSVTVTSKELQQFGNRNLVTSLRNIDPSFNIIESKAFGSNPNRLPEIQIRGNSSIPNTSELKDQTRVGLNTPLVILDGFESTLQRLMDINENEVESITILKDASATAIYGSRGANGVVVIKTKEPVVGKLRINYRADVNIEAPDLTAYNLLDAREKLDLEWQAGLYNNARAESDVPLKRYYNYLVNEVNRGVNTDWMTLPLRMGYGQRHNLGITGGDQTFRYSASAQINDVQGVMKESFRKNFNGTINLTYAYKAIKFTNQLMIGLGNSSSSPYGSFSDYVKMNPYWRPYDANGMVNKFLGDPGNSDYSNRWNPLPTNPLYNATLNTFDKSNNTSIINNFSVEWYITNDLLLRSRIGLTKLYNQSDAFRPANHTAFANYTTENIFRKGDYAYGVGNGMNYDGSVSLQYSKTIAQKHFIFAGFDYNMRQNQNSSYSFLAEGFTNPKFDFMSMAMQYAQGGKPSGSESLSRSVGLTGNASYTYNNRYFIDASVRTDGSSQFGSKNRFAPFWSTGLGWNLHEENFLKDSKIIDRLKIRGSVGITGSQNFSSYQALSTYDYYTSDRYYGWMGAYLMGLGNENLKWQQKMNYDIGFETQLFKQALQFTFDYYIGTTKDLVSSVDLPPSSGFTSYIENIGTMENRGFEAKATAFLLRNKKGFSWSISSAVFRNTNKIVMISKAMEDAQAAIIKQGGANPNQIFREGYSSNSIWVVPSLGIDPSTGKELYLNQLGEPTFVWSPLDLRSMGVTDPKYQGNVSTMFRYKTLSLNVSFGFRTGGQVYNSTLINKVENADYKYNVDARVYESRWKKPGDIVGFKALNITTPTQMTSRFIQNEKTITCQNINLQYDLRSKALKNTVGLEMLSFSVNMTDLFYYSTVKIERGTTYPFSHNISFSVNASF